MSIRIPGISLLLASLLAAGCAGSLPRDPSAPPPPQNMVGSTDELQLLTELARDQARQHGPERVLVVLEIDGTLLAPRYRPAAADSCYADAMQPIQTDAAEQVRRMQQAGLRVMVVTARSPACLDQTLAALRQNGFDFTASAWPTREGFQDTFTPEGAARPVRYTQGVLFVAGQDKGAMLNALLAKSGVPNPVLVIAADHERKSLNAFMKAFSWTGTKVQTWHYTRQPPSMGVAQQQDANVAARDSMR